MLQTILPLLEIGRQEWNDNIKMLLYKNNEDIFDHLDFEDESIYANPFINLYFSSDDSKNHQDLIKTILYSNWSGDKQIVISDSEKTYIRNLGWIDNAKFNKQTDLQLITEKPTIIENTKIELLIYKESLLDQCFGDYEYDIENISKKHIPNITKAYQLIKNHFPEYFSLLETYSPYNLIFSTDPKNTNSFASQHSLGIAFFNAFQENYDEVYFIEDIAHQTGHVLLYTILSNKEEYFLVNDQLRIREFIGDEKGDFDIRTIEIWFHAQFNAYFIIRLLDHFIDSDLFSSRQKVEAIGRLGLYLKKTYRDMCLVTNDFEKSHLFPDKGLVINETIINKILTEKGAVIFEQIKDNWNHIYQKNYDEVFQFSYKEQGSNFNFSIFMKNNPQCLEA